MQPGPRKVSTLPAGELHPWADIQVDILSFSVGRDFIHTPFIHVVFLFTYVRCFLEAEIGI